MREKIFVLNLLEEAHITVEEALLLLTAMTEKAANKQIGAEENGLEVKFYLKRGTDV